MTALESDAVMAPRGNWIVDAKYRFPSRYLVSWVALIAVGAGVAVMQPATFAGPSVSLITAIAGVLVLASIGQLLLVMLGAIDLSVASMITLAAAVNVHYLDSLGSAGSFALAIAMCMGISLISGVLITFFHLNSLIVTLAMNTIVSASLLLWMGQTFSTDGQAPPWLRSIATSYKWNVSAIFVVAVVFAVSTAFFLGRTRAGRRLVATGANRRAAHVLGVRINRLSLLTFVAAGAFYAVAGSLLAGFVRVPNADLGTPYMLLTVTTVAMAGAVFAGGPVSVSSLIAACLLLQVLDQALAIENFSPGVRLMVQGVVLILAVAANTLMQFGRSGFTRLRSLGSLRGK
ncbi:ABC transporter permease [Rhodococcus sp. WS1]|uniref:ABC transporter permease n=1 Tax=unclassified Rhodococcus (in: high G+C Gram-positive bacteria) TaxID=192944 RepID=UPI00114125D9|nr:MULTISPECIES: ABC transporter permease [unclassified Rhodococcus (in: high G+C Gram-positive bacteria)]ROZ52927.1 ABC transporter permease [Rhodococcus sp. WS1]TQC36019.1 ABC transporter permease [Rhodococcus sp. WS7]